MSQKEPESSVEMIMKERIRHYKRVEGTPRFACYDHKENLIGYYDTETGRVYDTDDNLVGLGFAMLAKLTPRE